MSCEKLAALELEHRLAAAEKALEAKDAEIATLKEILEKTFQAKSPSGGDAEVSIAVVCAKGKLEYQK